MAVASKALVIIRKEGSTLREVTRFRDGLWQRHYPIAHVESHTITKTQPKRCALAILGWMFYDHREKHTDVFRT